MIDWIMNKMWPVTFNMMLQWLSYYSRVVFMNHFKLILTSPPPPLHIISCMCVIIFLFISLSLLLLLSQPQQNWSLLENSTFPDKSWALMFFSQKGRKFHLLSRSLHTLKGFDVLLWFVIFLKSITSSYAIRFKVLKGRFSSGLEGASAIK